MRWISFAFANLMRNRRRSLVMLLVISVGVSAVLVGGGFALYTYDSLREMSAREHGHLILAQQHHFERHEESPLQYGLSGYQRYRSALELLPEVRAVLPLLSFSGLISNGDKSAVFLGKGVTAGEFRVKGPFLKVLEGRTLPTRPVEGEDPAVMIGQGLAEKMNATIGSSLTLLSTTVDGALNALDVKVHGVYSTGVPDLDKRNLLLGLEAAQFLMRSEKISTLGVHLTETTLTAPLQQQFRQQFPELAIQSWRDQAFYYVAVKGLYNRIFGMLGGIVLLMVFFAITNALTMSVVERTREIGTLRALGTHPYEIVRNFILEALAMSSVGVVVGSLLATGIALFLMFADFQMPPPGRSEGYPLHVEINGWLMLWTALGVTLLSIVAAWISSRKASRLPITEALAHV